MLFLVKKVVTFKVEDEQYQELKECDLSFKDIFVPLATRFLEIKKQYTNGIRGNDSVSYDNITKTIDDMLNGDTVTKNTFSDEPLVCEHCNGKIAGRPYVTLNQIHFCCWSCWLKHTRNHFETSCSGEIR